VNDYLLSFLLGIVEGVTEFLPVSSTAHLRISEALLHVDLSSEYWKMYSIVIQLGAILCLPVYFRDRIRTFLSTFPRGARGDRTLVTHPLSLALVATAMTAIPGFLLKKVISANLENLTVMGVALLVGGGVMWVVDAMHARSEAAGAGAAGGRIRTWHMEDMSLAQAVWIGLCQTLAAVFPGASRSMTTIAAGQLAGMSRASALEFSFFLSMPTMAIATAYDFWKWLKIDTDLHRVVVMTNHDVVVLAIGFVVSFLVAYGSVAWFMAWVRKHGFVPFAIYRLIVGAAVLLWLA
jgi:undecaprenyl-diphosphatase